MKSTKRQIKIFENNKHWIFREEPKINGEEEFEKYFEEYKRLTGQDDEETYRKNLSVFFKVTFRSYVMGDLSKTELEDDGFWNRDESWSCWCGYLGDINNAGLYFDSIDNIHAYT